jgi:hypothetical protein
VGQQDEVAGIDLDAGLLPDLARGGLASDLPRVVRRGEDGVYRIDGAAREHVEVGSEGHRRRAARQQHFRAVGSRP